MTRKLTTAALAALALGAGAAPALAVSPETLVAHTANWLERQGFQVDSPVPVHMHDTPAASQAAWQWGGDVPGASSTRAGVTIFSDSAAGVRSLGERYGRRGRLTLNQRHAARLVVHEIVHRVSLDQWYATDGRVHRDLLGHTQGWWEEGIVEAVTLDLMPHFTRQLFGHIERHPERSGAPSYVPRMQAVRIASVFATWPGRWADREATAWRSRLLNSTFATRAAMLRDAHTTRVEWGARTGR